jgi:hypothetical protein
LGTIEKTIIGMLFTLFVTGVIALPGFALPSSDLLPKGYYHIQNPKRLKKVYQSLRVEGFRKLLLFAFWGKDKNRKHYF